MRVGPAGAGADTGDAAARSPGGALLWKSVQGPPAPFHQTPWKSLQTSSNRGGAAFPEDSGLWLPRAMEGCRIYLFFFWGGVLKKILPTLYV